jgi:hypothetical protein
MFLIKYFKRGTASQKENVNFMSTTLAETQITPTNLATDLSAAEASFNAAVTAKTKLEQQIAGARKANETAELYWNSADREFFAERRSRAVNSTRSQLAGLLPRVPAAERAVRESEAVLIRVRRQVADHPKYAAALKEQRKLISEALELARQSWAAPILGIRDIVENFRALCERESNFIMNTNIQFREIGLPPVLSRLEGVGHAVPSDMAEIDVTRLAKEAAIVIEQLRK